MDASIKFIRRIVPETSTSFQTPTVLFPMAGASVDLWFTQGLYYASGTVAVTDELSCSRASTGYAQNSSGVWIPFSNNVLRITDLGMLVEGTRTNFLLNSDSPATQTTGSLSNGNYCLWVNGTGSATTSAGTATITGAGAATDGSPNRFAVTSPGTVVVTVAGTLTRFQLEDQTFPTSYIPTTGTTAVRASDGNQAINLLDTFLKGTSTTVLVDAINEATDAAGSPGVLGILMGDSATGQGFKSDGSHNNQVNIDWTIKLNATTGGPTWSVGAKAAAAWTTGARSVVMGGGTVATDANSGWSPTTIYLGTYDTAASWFIFWHGYFRRFTVFNSKLSDATLQGDTT